MEALAGVLKPCGCAGMKAPAGVLKPVGCASMEALAGKKEKKEKKITPREKKKALRFVLQEPPKNGGEEQKKENSYAGALQKPPKYGGGEKKKRKESMYAVCAMRCVLCGLCLCPFVFVARGTFLVCAFTGATCAAVARGCGPFVKTRTSGKLQAATGCESGISHSPIPSGEEKLDRTWTKLSGKWGAGFSRRVFDLSL
jgi:hypothetical protein